MSIGYYCVVFFTLFGHVTIWAAIWNRLHGIGLSRGVSSRLTAILIALGATLPSLYLALVVSGDAPVWARSAVLGLGFPASVLACSIDAYIALCWLALPYAILWRVVRKFQPKAPVYAFTVRRPILAGSAEQSFFACQVTGMGSFPAVANSHLADQGDSIQVPAGWTPNANEADEIEVSRAERATFLLPASIDKVVTDTTRGYSPEPKFPGTDPSGAVRESTRSRARSAKRHILLRLPGNESLECEHVDLGIYLKRLPEELSGLTVVQLSDLHFTGRISQEYYFAAVSHVNQLKPDFIFVTGDLVDRADCLDDGVEVLRSLKATFGVFFVLGNHDLRAGAERVRRALSQAGLVDVGGRVVKRKVRGLPILIGGNELPWLGPAPDFSAAPNGDRIRPLRFLLAHTPDQFPWAVQNDVDLMLAGHTHGGQVCLPWLGPVIAPSSFGIRYAEGLHYRHPTVMYVNRGLGGEFPVRYCCPPEITRVILFAENAAGDLPAKVPQTTFELANEIRHDCRRMT